ncbi:sodium:solute symporter [Novimethylophilus kurashikiensis]|uniref:Sodium:solute symporter n=1 Tax=Novimethylophilus kurashikiensis TaxID=1825523 RepID=A0A2R5F9G2_9PROT|nr:hypothetical protein [Novimethylophilus kurashikiensis]GBG14837.1 sodium:solute symporter [Novimethylophilus kurashikiensis]
MSLFTWYMSAFVLITVTLAACVRIINNFGTYKPWQRAVALAIVAAIMYAWWLWANAYPGPTSVH